MRKSKRVLVVNDFHSGHLVGLTPPKHDIKHENPDFFKLDKMRRTYWNYFDREVKALGPIDITIVVGDCIEGKNEKAGGTELLEADTTKQCMIAETILKGINTDKMFMVYGTNYHTGDVMDAERTIADSVGATKIGSHDWIDVNGLIIDYKHHVGSSQVPYARHTAVARERMWNLFWNEWDEFPKADVFLRGHVHYYDFCGGYGWLAMTLPALQGYGSKFGSRICSGTVDFGFVHFDVTDKDNYSWAHHILKIRRSKQPITTQSLQQTFGGNLTRLLKRPR
jgi:hypothetical protein